MKKKDDMKYYKNLVKIVGKEHCLILSAEDSKYLDFFVAKCKSVIEALRAKKNTRKSLIKKNLYSLQETLSLDLLKDPNINVFVSITVTVFRWR